MTSKWCGAAEMNAKDMSLRDYFAAKALQGHMASLAHPDIDHKAGLDVKEAARYCYELADAMLAARDEGNQPDECMRILLEPALLFRRRLLPRNEGCRGAQSALHSRHAGGSESTRRPVLGRGDTKR